MPIRNSAILLHAATEGINSPGTQTFIKQKGFVYKISFELRGTCKHCRQLHTFLIWHFMLAVFKPSVLVMMTYVLYRTNITPR